MRPSRDYDEGNGPKSVELRGVEGAQPAPKDHRVAWRDPARGVELQVVRLCGRLEKARLAHTERLTHTTGRCAWTLSILVDLTGLSRYSCGSVVRESEIPLSVG